MCWYGLKGINNEAAYIQQACRRLEEDPHVQMAVDRQAVGALAVASEEDKGINDD